ASGFQGIDAARIALQAAAAPGAVLAEIFEKVGFAVKVANAAIGGMRDLVNDIKKGFVEADAKIRAIPWADTGIAIVKGIVKGMTGVGLLEEAAGKLGEVIKSAYERKLEMHSPSRVFEKSSENIPEGAARGIEKGAPRVQAAADAMAPSPA